MSDIDPQRVAHLDYETFSKASLAKGKNNVGGFRYANDPSTEILCAALAFGEDEPVCWQYGNVFEKPTDIARWQDYMERISDPDTIIFAHNAQFEVAITEALWEKTFQCAKPHHRQFRCTAAMCRRASLPASLEDAGKYLQLAEQKDGAGKSLIRLFSVMQTGKLNRKTGERAPNFRVLPTDKPEKFKQFVEYCKQDVRVERLIEKALYPFTLKGHVLDTWLADLEVNMRGMPVNLKALHHAQQLIEEAQEEARSKFFALTGVQVSQRDKVLSWMQEHGYKGTTLRAGDVDDALEEAEEENDDDLESETEGMDAIGVEALKLRKETAFAAVTKVRSMLQCAGPHDNRVRGTLIWHGPTTGRWAGALIQPQNFKRPTRKDTTAIYKAICAGWEREFLEMAYGPTLPAIANCIRHFIQPTEGVFLQADYAAIEARIVVWLADETQAVQEFVNGVDRYISMASVIFNIDKKDIGKESFERFVGKQTVLLCGFQGSADAFIRGCAQYKIDVPREVAEKAVATFREQHPRLRDLWYAAERACKAAIMHPGTKFPIKSKQSKRVAGTAFTVRIAGINFLLIRLPSGRHLAYPDPRIAGDEDYITIKVKGKEVQKQLKPGGIHFYGQPKTSKGYGTKVWSRIEIYGGLIVQNMTQGTAADCTSQGLVNCERAGYEVCSIIHDEFLAEKKPGNTLAEYIKLLTTLPAWAEGLPIKAEGKEIPYYLK